MKECYKVCLALLLLIFIVLGYSLTNKNYEGFKEGNCSEIKNESNCKESRNGDNKNSNKCKWNEAVEEVKEVRGPRNKKIITHYRAAKDAYCST